jgi:hypothetical protein
MFQSQRRSTDNGGEIAIQIAAIAHTIIDRVEAILPSRDFGIA